MVCLQSFAWEICENMAYLLLVAACVTLDFIDSQGRFKNCFARMIKISVYLLLLKFVIVI